MQWRVAMLAAIFLGWCGSSMTSPIDNDRTVPWNLWNLQPLELKWDTEGAPESMQNSRLSAVYDPSWPIDEQGRWKRGDPNISIMAPMDVLRHRLWLEMRRRAEMQIQENKKMMESVGKRKKRYSTAVSSYPALSQHLIHQLESDDADTIPQWAKRV